MDASWSAWAAGTSAQYDLANGAYTFWVRAKDEAGNYTGEETPTIGVPTNYSFVVNAAPKVASAVRIAHSVWASRVTLEMPAAAGQPGNTFVLLEREGIELQLAQSASESEAKRAMEFIKTNGGKVTSSISSKTDFVVVGESPGSKLKQARERKIREISEEELRKMVE